MKIFDVEKNDGLSELLSATASICYASIAEPSPPELCTKLNIKALAGLDDKDLYYTQSILVTTSWNKNDDIFDKIEVWNAKDTPIHKPTNLEHNENTIVGHITSNWPITNDGILIDTNTDINNLPEKYHILTGSVIYVGYTEKDLRDRAEKLIAEIESGTKYVSMECFFKGFDYGLINKSTGKYQILNRNDETAFLTKHLRAYGGVGEYQDHKIGRVLKSITFSGKGFVDKPANPESIIFTKNSIQFHKDIQILESEKEKSNNFGNIGVFSNQANLKENEMSLEKEVAEIKTKIEAMADCSAAVAEAKALASDLETKNNELSQSLQSVETTLAETKSALEALTIEKEEAAKKMEEDMKKKEEEMSKVKSELDTALETLAGYKAKEAEMMKKEKNMKRMAALVEKGVDSELANSTVSKFEHIDDEAFESMTSLIAGKMPDWLMKNKKNKEKASEVDSEESALETAEVTEDVVLSVGSDGETEMQNTRAALVEFVCNRLGTKLNKGE